MERDSNQSPLPTQEHARQANKVEKARNSLHVAIDKYRKILKDSTLPKNKDKQSKEHQMQMFSDINHFATELELINVGEGFMTLAITALNSIVVMHDEINELKFQNYMLHKKILELSKPVEELPKEQIIE